MPTYDADDLPAELAAIPAVKPGSRAAREPAAAPRRQHRPCRDHPQRARRAASRPGARGRGRGGGGARRHHRAPARGPAAHHRRRHRPADGRDRPAAEPGDGGDRGDARRSRLRHRPHAACIVPEKREERTTEGGLDAAGQHDTLQPFVDRLGDAGIRVSLFIEPSERAGRRRAAARRAGGRVPHRALRPCRGRGARGRAEAHRRRRRARRQERHRAACRPRPDLRQCRADRRHPAARRAQHRPFPGRRGDLHRAGGAACARMRAADGSTCAR